MNTIKLPILRMKCTNSHILIFGMLLLAITGCKPIADKSATINFLNLADSASYVGMETCIQCHQDIYQSFKRNGMGKSFDHASRQKSVATFDEHSIVYDESSNFYYQPHWQKDTLYILEFRMNGIDTIHKRKERVSYIIGSGHHTNSHMVDFNGFIYQAPITFYAQKAKWDMAPGFENGFNSRFSRVIKMECMTCHNGLPEIEPGSENKYLAVKNGIDCERCHGPGSIHVNKIQSGEITDTARAIDYSIVNPKHLSVNLQMNLCQRCHLQGVTILNEGMSFADFRPGMELSEVMNVFLPKSSDENQFLMASHVERLVESRCFKSQKISCITCHNPHKTIEDQRLQFNLACQKCHIVASNSDCLLPIAERTPDNNCVNCHMPKSGSIDIPHVLITDHKIRVVENTTSIPELETGSQSITLELMTGESPAPNLKAKGYLRFFEAFSQQAQYLDSARHYLAISEQRNLNDHIHLYYLEGQTEKIIEIALKLQPQIINDGYTCYRIAEAFMINQSYGDAIVYAERAKELMPYQLDFIHRLGSLHSLKGNFERAIALFENVLDQQPKYVPSISNLGIIYINLGRVDEGLVLLKSAISLDPDYQQAYINLTEFYIQHYKKAEAYDLVEQMLLHLPGNEFAQSTLEKLQTL